jgi:hypothetical protein
VFARKSQRASVAPAGKPSAPGGDPGAAGRRASSGRPRAASRRRTLAAWTGALTLGALSAVQAAPASAAATLEPRPTAAPAPTDRVLEQVSPVDKSGVPVYHTLAVAEEGDGLLFHSLGAFGDVQSNMLESYYRARRGTHGWETVGMQPQPRFRAASQRDRFRFEVADEQLDSLIASSHYPFVEEALPYGTAGRVVNLKTYRFGEGGAVDWLSSDTPSSLGTIATTSVAAVSRDTQRLLLVGATTTNPDTAVLYVRDGERTVVVGVDPNGDRPSSGVRLAGGRDMSDDGQTVAFFPGAPGGSRGNELYVRRNALRPNADTVIANRSRRAGDPAGAVCGTATSFGLSADGRRLLFTCNGPLTDDAPATGTGIYVYETTTDELRFLDAAEVPTGIVGGDRDLRRLYLADGLSGELWLVDGDGAREIVPGAGSLGGVVSRDGEQLAFISDRGLDGGYAGRQMYVYDATDGADGSLTCVSCRPGASSGGDVAFGPGDLGLTAPRDSNGRTDSFTADGAFYFMSPDALTPDAPQGPSSVYEYRNGKVRLMVAGSGGDDARFGGVSPDGTNVFVLTKQSLLPQDDDYPVQDVYSFRRGDGFPTEPECQDCTPPTPEDRGGPRPEGPIASGQDVPASHGARDPAPPAAVKPSVVGRKAHGTTARIRVRVGAAGTVRVTGSGVRGVSRRVTKAGTYTVNVRLSAYGRRVLERRGRLPLRLTVRLAPKAGVGGSAKTTLTIKKTTRKAA